MKTIFETVGKLAVLVALLFVVGGVVQKISLVPNKESPKEVEARWIREDQERINKKHELETIIRPICEKHGGVFSRLDHSFTLGHSEVKILSADVCVKDGYTYRFEERKYNEVGGMWARTQDIDECASRQEEKEYRASPQYKKDIEERKSLPNNVMIIRDVVPTDEQIKRGCLNK